MNEGMGGGLSPACFLQILRNSFGKIDLGKKIDIIGLWWEALLFIFLRDNGMV